ncbi:hypothetical protein B0H13DRAFT_1931237, partial [Mycena leptocephala]
LYRVAVGKLSEAYLCCPQPLCTPPLFHLGVLVHVLVIKLFDFNSSSRRAQETVSPESGDTPRNAEGHSICIKAEKIVSDRGPKGMQDSKPAGQPSSQNIRNFSYMSRVTGGMFKYPKQVTKSAGSAQKIKFFARPQRVQFKTPRRSHEMLIRS